MSSSHPSGQPDHTVASSSLFTASDPDGDTITQYAIWDTGGNGHWWVNGVAQAAGTEIDGSAARLSQGG
ncbi:hypothetical protein ABTM14_19945, partial [Acinetobacter baumannii]